MDFSCRDNRPTNADEALGSPRRNREGHGFMRAVTIKGEQLLNKVCVRSFMRTYACVRVRVLNALVASVLDVHLRVLGC